MFSILFVNLLAFFATNSAFLTVGLLAAIAQYIASIFKPQKSTFVYFKVPYIIFIDSLIWDTKFLEYFAVGLTQQSF